ncbi:hypothetical protein [Pseudanabaena mucicola]|uniref:hypothetical protein n=1 Tax=Pseudanabaena mucicola TaxID=71190 RepID=UPI00167FF34C|nr:hypothetical protein [Pseudanabaena mucicola]
MSDEMILPIAYYCGLGFGVNVGAFGQSITNWGGSVIFGDGGGNAMPLGIFV